MLTAQQDLTAKIKEKTNSEEHIAMGNEESIIRTVVEAEEHPVGSPTTEEYSFSEIEDALCVAIDRTAPTDKDKKLYNEYNDGPMQVEATDFLNPSPDSRLAPHLRHMMKKATDADTVQPIFREKVWSCNPAIKSRKSDAAVQAWLDAQEAAAQPSTLHSNEEKPLSDTLIDFASNSPVSEKKKVVPVPPGFTPVEPKTPAVTTNRAEAAPDAFKAEVRSTP